MNKIINNLKLYFNNYDLSVFFLSIISVSILCLFFMEVIAPILLSIIISYLLYNTNEKIKNKYKIPNYISSSILITGLFSIIYGCLLLILPLVLSQLIDLLKDFPTILTSIKDNLKDAYFMLPGIVTDETFKEVMTKINASIQDYTIQLGKILFNASYHSLIEIGNVLVLLILIPLMSFFFLKDGKQILDWIKERINNDTMLYKVFSETDIQIGNYIRGKIIEAVIVGVVSYIFYLLIGLDYILLLSIITGLSVFIPFIGATIVTIPVVIIAYSQFGFSNMLLFTIIGYIVMQILDGNVLSPLLFSELIQVKPVWIIISIIVFGGLWGFAGVFFAIPITILIKSTVNNWPNYDELKKRE